MSDIRSFCNNPKKVLVSYKRFLFFKFNKKYKIVPCGLCVGCRSVRTDISFTLLREVSKCSDMSYSDYLRKYF